MYIELDSMYVTMSISTGLYPKLDLWKANKFHYSTWPSVVVEGVVGSKLLSLIRKNQSPSKFNKFLLLCKYKFESGLRQEA